MSPMPEVRWRDLTKPQQELLEAITDPDEDDDGHLWRYDPITKRIAKALVRKGVMKPYTAYRLTPVGTTTVTDARTRGLIA